MLLLRVLTAVPLAIAVIWLILFQPTAVLLYFLLFIAFVCGYEWARLAGVKSVLGQLAFAILVSAISWLCTNHLMPYVYGLLLLATVWWFAMPFFLRVACPKLQDAGVSVPKLLIALLLIPATIMAMFIIHGMDRGPEWLLYSLMLVWVADSGAYFSGKKLGKTKLAPNVSPGKTREGLWGALLATCLYSVIAAYYFELEGLQWLILIGMSSLLTVLSVGGDLYESCLKREAGLKDSGNILPGHGGILDRVDGVLAVMPVFVVLFDLSLISIEGLR